MARCYAGFLADRTFYVDAKSTDFKIEIAVVVIVIHCLAFGPILAWRRAWLIQSAYSATH